MKPARIHLLVHANPIGPDIKRLGLADSHDYLAFIRRHLPAGYRLTCDEKLIDAVEDPWHGGRHDDAARIRDLQGALNDRRTLAIVAAGGGGYFSRIVPHIDFGVLARRREPLWALGFSEMTTLVGLVASYRCGRGLYWLCPNWLAWQLRPVEAAQAAFGEFWHVLPDVLAGRVPADAEHLVFNSLEGEVVAGRVQSGRVRLVGGCLAVLAAITSGPTGRRLRPDGKWLILEDIKESPYRIDRHLAALKHAGWFEQAAGLLVGDFKMMHEDTQPAVLGLLRYHLPRSRRVPVVRTRSFGHIWPMPPVMLNRNVQMTVRRGRVLIEATGLATASS